MVTITHHISSSHSSVPLKLGPGQKARETQDNLHTYLSPHPVVVDSHPCLDVPGSFPGIQEIPRELLSKVHVMVTATPFPCVLGAGAGVGAWARTRARQGVGKTFAPGQCLQLQQFGPQPILLTTPLPATAAAHQLAQAAGCGYRVHDASSQHGEGKGTLTETWG